ncbi:MAG TPA: DUF1501 domain-containing protein [Gemmataceae bacterium]|nr:DUF1501 domain-containing protein [Gemmataceae bacterium]
MLTFWDNPANRSASRRDFLKVGALGLGGLSLADVLRLRAGATETPRHRPKSVIMVVLAGGPSHIDMYDMKPNAPVEYRGEFSPIRTNLPGLDICEHMPRQAIIADKLALVRTVQYFEPMQHELQEVYTGALKSARKPAFGCVVSKFKANDRQMPSYVSLEYSEGTTPYENPEYLGAQHRPLHVSGGPGVRNLSLANPSMRPRLDERRSLLESFDVFRRDLDVRRDSVSMDAYASRAFDIITSTRARDAFDLGKEPARVREKYGPHEQKYSYVSQTLDSVWDGEKFLLARRLVEAGVSVVTLRVGSWDHHGNVIAANGGKSIWWNLRTVLPLLDRSIHALITDLHERGLQDDVAVLVWGEMGRTPRVSQAGRDHWMDAGYALWAGAVRTGQVIGETDSRAERPRSRGVTVQNVHATLYDLLGIDTSQTVPDFAGRPQYLLEEREPIRELL